MRFSVAIWAVTRLLILCAFLIASPHGTVAAFAHWDGGWYGSIVQRGYEFSTNGQKHNVAFFPLFPLLSSILTHVGLAWPISGIVVSNAAFLAAVLVLYTYARDRLGVGAARWTVAVACAAPLSLFCSVTYAESLLILLSAVALLCYYRRLYVYAGLAAGAAASAHPLGIALAFALLLSAVVERQSPRSILGCALGIVGAGAFPVFCFLQFGDILAFAHAQTGWHHPGFDAAGWLGILRGAKFGSIHDRISIGFVVVALPCVVLFRKLLGSTDLLFCGMCLIVLVFSGTPFSLDRHLYAIVPILMALGELFRRVPVVGYIVALASLVILGIDAETFAHAQWVA